MYLLNELTEGLVHPQGLIEAPAKRDRKQLGSQGLSPQTGEKEEPTAYRRDDSLHRSIVRSHFLKTRRRWASEVP
jgi:hypothetical protein